MNVLTIIETVVAAILLILLFILIKSKKKLRLSRILVLFFLILILVGHLGSTAFLEKPCLSINGNEIITIQVNTNYEELGAKATYHKKDVSSQIEIQTTLDITKVGEYQVIYHLAFEDTVMTKQRTIKVVDTIPPEIKLKGDKQVNVPENSGYVEEGVEVSDNSAEDLESKVQISKEEINQKKYLLHYQVTDSSGNQSATVTRTIHIVEPIKTDNKNKQGVIYLTFDDGPSLDITPKILDILKEENIKATFFILNYDKNREFLVKRIVNEGHTIGIHGYSHEYKEIYTSVDAYMNNIKKLQDKIKNSTGVDTKFTRFPGGSSNTVSKKYCPGIMTALSKKLVNNGYYYYDWNVSSEDAGGAKTKEAVYHNVTTHLKKTKANMVLMHDFARNHKTLEALREIIRFGKQNGYVFEAIDTNTPMITQHINN